MMLQYETELYHHGIPGQKWGVRRYQNPDDPDVQKVHAQEKHVDEAEKRFRKQYDQYIKQHPNSKMDLKEYSKLRRYV